MKQYVGKDQRRIVRGQPIRISEDVLKRDLEELRTKHANHIIEVRTLDGRLVDLTTLEPGPSPVIPPRPNPRLDSLANDRNFPLPEGYKFVPPYMSDDSSMPQVVPEGGKPALLQEDQIQTTETAPTEEEKLAAGELPSETADAPTEAQGDDTELDAALAAAQTDAAPEGTEDVSSDESPKKGRRNRR
jgi:hypothetical protein